MDPDFGDATYRIQNVEYATFVELTNLDDQDPGLGMRPLKSSSRQHVSIPSLSERH